MTDVSATTTTTTTTDDGTAAPSGPSELDLAFIIDATASMGSYISSAQTNMKNIIQDIIISEKCLLNVALILYRDHPPQDSSFIIKVHDFTDDAEEAKTRIDGASASGGGDGPEAVAPALHAAVHTLTWRKNAVKIAILIADAPPHGLEKSGDGFPDGDPSGHDPVECVAALAEKGATLYTIGCEPAATPYRDFFMALAFKTGGQYIPLANCVNLASVIVGSAKEEISLERLLAQVHEEVMQEAAARGGPVDETELTRRIHEVMKGGGATARRVKMTNSDGTDAIPALTPAAEELSKLNNLKEVQGKWTRNNTVPMSIFGGGSLFGTTTTTTGLGLGLVKRPILRAKRTGRVPRTAMPVGPRKRKATATPTPAPKKRTASRTKPATLIKPIIKKTSTRPDVHGGRRSARLAFRTGARAVEDDEEESTEPETMDTTPSVPAVKPKAATKAKRPSKTKATPVVPEPAVVSVPVTTKPTKVTREVSNINLAEDELLDISQTRRLVRKCIARNKLKST